MTRRRGLLIGLTGNIGTGKSTVAQMLVGLGAEVIDADGVAHEVMRAGSPVHTQVVEAFGREIVRSDGEIDRKQLGGIVFADSAALAQLEAIVHPATLEAIKHRVATTLADVVVVEAIKLIEAGMVELCDSVWVTICKAEQQVQRIMDARDLTRTEAEQRVQAQAPHGEKINYADVVIDSSGSLSETRAQVEAAWGRLIRGETGGMRQVSSGDDSSSSRRCQGD